MGANAINPTAIVPRTGAMNRKDANATQRRSHFAGGVNRKPLKATPREAMPGTHPPI